MHRVRTHLGFRSDAFPAEPGEQERINPGRWGAALARYLRTELTARGLAGAEPYPEDWGWAVPLDNLDFSLWVGCGNNEEYRDGFHCFIDPRTPFVRKLFRKIDTSVRVENLATALKAALLSHPSVSGLRCWTDKR
jgi:hypothetical protein